MNSKLKKLVLSFLILFLMDIIGTSSRVFFQFGIENPHVGLLFVLGLFFGPYGALGAVLANIIINILDGFTIVELLPSAIISFGVSYLAYKIWYSGFRNIKIIKPRLNDINHLILFLLNILICGLIFSAAHSCLIGFFLNARFDQFMFFSYFLNFVNVAFIFGVIGIWISKKRDFVDIPKIISKKPYNKKLYKILFCLLIIVSLISAFIIHFTENHTILAFAVTLISILLFAYLTKPFEYEIQESVENTIIENIIRIFLIITFVILILGALFSILSYNFINISYLNVYLHLMPTFIITDIIMILFFIPGIFILKYIENEVVKPISSFSEIESFIKENEKIEAEKFVEIYSKYINEKNEIGTLARSYTELINHNNNYIQNIREIEGEKERINTELDIATKIQESTLPTESLENDDFIIDGYSQPAKEVGGDFFDYYSLDDDNLAIVIGDASGKGVPAAIVAMITQVMIKHMFDSERDPSKILSSLNNQIYENNAEYMFITLWVGIYSRKSHKIRFSNAGHNPPLIKEKDKFKYLDIESGIVLGIVDDFKYVLEEVDINNEIILYTDGITDATNLYGEMYGPVRFLKFVNGFKTDEEPIRALIENIDNFTKGAEQFDDMTLLYLKLK